VIEHTIKTDGDKFLNWPTKDAIVISAYYHDEKYKKQFGWEHDAIDIKVKQGSPIYAAAA
jgi:murein DD-endopeptidase MepM/ murein hydrolase activator NlpD